MSKLTKRHGWILGASVPLSALALFAVGRAVADGVPAVDPLFYSGTLLEGGVPVDGSRSVAVSLWNSETSTSPADRLCETESLATTVTNGRFRMALDPACADAVHANPDLWVEIIVGTTSLGRRKLGAVPYALEADHATTASNGVPPGTIASYAGGALPPPAGWLVCDGQAVSRATYPALFAAIGTNWGEPDALTFNVPDLRGRFLRGTSPSGGLDPDCALRAPAAPGGATGCDQPGTVQDDELTSHAHSYALSLNPGYNNCNACGNYDDLAEGGTSSTSPTGGTETRPLNAAVTFIIKY